MFHPANQYIKPLECFLISGKTSIKIINKKKAYIPALIMNQFCVIHSVALRARESAHKDSTKNKMKTNSKDMIMRFLPPPFS